MGSERPQLELVEPESVMGPPTPVPAAPKSSVGSVSVEGGLEDVEGRESERRIFQVTALPGIVKVRDGVHDRVRSSQKRCLTAIVSAAGTGTTPVYESTSTPLPITEKEQGGGSGGGGGNDGDGGPPKKKKGGSGEHPAVNAEKMLVPTEDVLEAARLVETRHGIKIETPLLYPTSESQQFFRKNLFFTQTFLETIHSMQQDPDFSKIRDVEKLYSCQGKRDAYKAGEVPVSNLAIMNGFYDKESGTVDHTKLFCSIEGPTFERKKSIELAPGNGEISRDLRETRNVHFIKAVMRFLIKSKGRVTNGRYDLAEKEATREAEKLPKSNDPYITSVDLVPEFVEKGRKRGINALRADICKTPLEFFEATGIEPNSADFIYMFLAFDRLEDLHATLKIIKMLAKKDGSTKFQFGFYAPFSPETISFSKNENIPEFQCFDPTNDLRQRWMGKKDAELSRAETICRIIADLNMMYGFKTKRLAEHEYEVYSVHCISEKAKTLREDPRYEFLKTYDFKDDELNAQRDAVFNGTVPDDQLVGFPERTPLILIGGDITLPEDGAAHGKIQIIPERKGKKRRIQVDPQHPKFEFLRNYDFGRRRLNRIRDRVFASKSSELLPHQAGMAAARIEHLKKIA